MYFGLAEEEVTLDIARRVAAAIDPTTYVVHLTRSGDVKLGNSERAAVCNAFGAQVVLSIHLNASSDPNVDYVWMFYGKPTKDKTFAATMDRNYTLSNPDGTKSLGTSRSPISRTGHCSRAMRRPPWQRLSSYRTRRRTSCSNSRTRLSRTHHLASRSRTRWSRDHSLGGTLGASRPASRVISREPR